MYDPQKYKDRIKKLTKVGVAGTLITLGSFGYVVNSIMERIDNYENKKIQEVKDYEDSDRKINYAMWGITGGGLCALIGFGGASCLAANGLILEIENSSKKDLENLAEDLEWW